MPSCGPVKLAPTYAPEIPIAGVVAASPVGDMRALARSIRDERAPNIRWLLGLQMVSVWSEVYGLPMDGILGKDDQRLAAALPDHCPDFDFAPSAQPFVVDLATAPGWQQQLESNTPGASRSDAPVLALHGTADGFLPRDTATPLVQRLCDTGDQLEFQSIPGADHGDPIYGEGQLDRIGKWTADRIAGIPGASTCDT